MHRNSSRWIEEYRGLGALWIHDGNPKRPHALLTSGRHSSGYFNSSLVTENPYLIEDAVIDLMEAVGNEIDLVSNAYVVGPALGAVVMSHCIAHYIQSQVTIEGRNSQCRSSFTEKIESADGPRMVLRRSSLKPGDRVLVVEDVFTTGGSVDRTIDAVTEAGGIAASVVAVLVNRSGLGTVRGGRKIVSLIDEPMPLWLPAECPLCKQGSEALLPKDTDHWARLNAAY